MEKNKLQHISDIPSTNYVGYLWLLSSQEPLLFDGTKSITVSDYINQDNPIVIEGLLYDKHKDISYHIVYTHRYIISSYHFVSEDRRERKEYVSHRLNGKKLVFEHLWESENDIFCNNFPTMKLKARVFKGFSNNNNEKDYGK